MGPGSRGACHRAALRADPFGLAGTTTHLLDRLAELGRLSTSWRSGYDFESRVHGPANLNEAWIECTALIFFLGDAPYSMMSVPSQDCGIHVYEVDYGSESDAGGRTVICRFLNCGGDSHPACFCPMLFEF